MADADPSRAESPQAQTKFFSGCRRWPPAPQIGGLVRIRPALFFSDSAWTGGGIVLARGPKQLWKWCMDLLKTGYNYLNINDFLLIRRTFHLENDWGKA